jgi:hypothetical protein
LRLILGMGGYQQWSGDLHFEREAHPGRRAAGCGLSSAVDAADLLALRWIAKPSLFSQHDRNQV